MQFFLRNSLFLLPLIHTVRGRGPGGQGCGSLNQNDACQISTIPQSGATIFYDPNDTTDFTFQGQSSGTCDSLIAGNVSAFTELYSGIYPNLTFLYDCDCLVLNGTQQLIDCPGASRSPHLELLQLSLVTSLATRESSFQLIENY
jgi:hypothetical protein